ncbi:MAG: hypothetical protein D6776_10195 [Planctomycetota bacterium]|nr:MAG: hypothetical protein D6776_10195 [Planctomycetota bacterium]
MATFAKDCDLVQGYNLQRDAQCTLGYITHLQIGERKFDVDQSVTKPSENHPRTKVVGVMSNFEWEGGYASPFRITANVSTKNKQYITDLIHDGLSNTAVEVQIEIWDYDPIANPPKYFKSFSSPAVLKGLVLRENNELKLTVSDKPGEDVPSPQNYEMQLDVMPIEQDQDVTIATGVMKTRVKQWGVTVAAS